MECMCCDDPATDEAVECKTCIIPGNVEEPKEGLGVGLGVCVERPGLLAVVWVAEVVSVEGKVKRWIVMAGT